METNKITGNEPANVIDGVYGADAMRSSNGGLTIRQMFAMEAMKGILSNSNFSKLDKMRVSLEAVLQADALIHTLNVVEPSKFN